MDFVASRLRDSSVSSFDYWPKEELLALFKIQFPKEVSNSFDEFLKDSGNLESIAEKFEKKTGSKKPGDLICRKRRAIKFNFNEVAGWNAKPVLKKVQQIRSSIGMYVQVLFEENFLIEDSKNKVIKYFKNDQESNTVFKYFIEWRDYFILSEEDPVRCPKFKGLPDSKNIEPFLKGVYSNELDSNLYENLLKFRLTTTAPVKRKRVEENTPLNGDRSGKNKKGEFVSF